MWQVPRIWEGEDVWIFGGGPSVPRQFDIPEKVINSVIKGANPNIYSPYFEKLHTKHIIGINVAYLLGNWIDMIYFGDTHFFLTHKTGLSQHPAIKVSSYSGVQKFEWVKFVPFDRNHPRGISPNQNMVSWNKNSGSAAISLAAHTGAKRIILLGFDMKLSGIDQHWHDVYHVKTNDPNRMRKLPFYRHMLGFPEIAKDARRMGIEILNASPDSAIVDFKKVSVKDIL